MADINGKLAKKWAGLNTKNGGKAIAKGLGIVQAKDKQLVYVIGKIVEGYVKDLYGNASEEKYRNIVDLIINRVKLVLSDNISEFTSTSLEIFKQDILNEISAKLSSNSSSEGLISQSASKTIADEVCKAISSTIQDNCTALTKELQTMYESLHTSSKTEVDKEELDKNKTVLAESMSNYEEKYNKLYNKILEYDNIVKKTLEKTKPKEKTQAELKKEKKTKETNNKQIKVFKEILETLDKIKEFTDNFLNFMVKSLDKFLDKTFRVFTKFFLRIFTFIMIPLVTLFAGVLYLLAKPINDILAPILKFIASIVKSIATVITAVLNTVVGPLIHFIIDVIGPPLAKVLTSVADMIVHTITALDGSIVTLVDGLLKFITVCLETLTDFMKGVGTNAFGIGVAFSKFVIESLDVLTLFLSGFKVKAFLIGQKISEFCVVVIDVLIEFVRGFAGKAYEIGVAIAEFTITVLDLLTAFFKGLGSKAFEIGAALANIVIQISNVIANLVEFLGIPLKILIAIADIVSAFFEGFGTNARKIGEQISKFILITVEGFVSFLTPILARAEDLGNFISNGLRVVLGSINMIFEKILVWLGGESTLLEKTKETTELLRPIFNVAMDIKLKFMSMLDSLSNIEVHIIAKIQSIYNSILPSLTKLNSFVTSNRDSVNVNFNLFSNGVIQGLELCPKIEKLLTNITTKTQEFIAKYNQSDSTKQFELSQQIIEPKIEKLNSVRDENDKIFESTNINNVNAIDSINGIVKNIKSQMVGLLNNSKKDSLMSKEKIENILHKIDEFVPMIVTADGSASTVNPASMENR